MNKPGQHPRELNPYWKDGGAGLPSDSRCAQGNVEGRSWLLRSYKRAIEQAKKKGVTFQEIAEKQWGSVEKIHSLLRSVGINPSLPDFTSCDQDTSDKSKLFSQPNFDANHFRQKLSVLAKDRSMPSKSFLRPGDCVNKEVVYPQCSSSMHEDKPQQIVEETKHDFASAASNDIVTDAMINSASAKLIKAELIGNKPRCERLKLELEDLRSRKEKQNLKQQTLQQERTILLTKTDRFGRVRPPTIHRKNSAKGKSKRRLNDDLTSMVEMEHMTTANDTYEAIAKMASKFVRSNSDDVVDDVLDVSVKSRSREDDKGKLKAITQSRRMEEMLDSCKLCVNGSRFKKHLVIATGINTYISVPPYQSLTFGHCQIVPLEHTPCSLLMDENVWSEVKIFQRGMAKMFCDKNMDVIFSECYTSASKRSHMYIDCVPIPKYEGSMAPMYFKKAILESDTEWSENRKLIDTRQKGLKKSIPLGLPYFFVDFNNEGGFAHVIEDSSLFPHYFAKEVIGGLLDVEPRLWLNPRYESFEQQQAKTLKLIEMWKPYDWTEKLKP